MKQFILLAFLFPPHPGVGVFRWSQLCKYLARLDYTIHVVTVDWQTDREDTLLDAVRHPNIKIHRIPSGGPHNLRIKNFHNRSLNGVRNKIFHHCIDKHFFYDDEAQRWGKHCIPYCLKLMDSTGCSTVVATGTPFSVNLLAASLKKIRPGMRLVQDFRDIWSDNLAWRNKLHNAVRFREMEIAATSAADMNVTVAELCRQSFLSHNPNARFTLIRNGFDPEFYAPRPTREPLDKTQPKTMVHLGSIYGGREVACELLLDYVARHPDVCRAVFAGVLPRSLREQFKNALNFSFLGAVSPEQARKLLMEADVALNFNAKPTPEMAATKMYEYAAMGVPILSVDYGGEPSALVRDNAWGLSVNPDETDFDTAVTEFLEHADRYTPSYESVEKYSYVNIAGEYDHLLTELTSFPADGVKP